MLLAGIIVATLLVTGLIIRKLVSRGVMVKKSQPHIAAAIDPAPENMAAIELPGLMSVGYHDLGDSVEIKIASPGMPVLYIDTNQNGKVDIQGADLSFATSPNGSICVQRLGGPESADCGLVSTAASANVAGKSGDWKVTFKIPKKELSAGSDHAHIAFQIFNEQTQRGNYYPGAPFSQVYDFRFIPAAAKRAVEAHANPEPSPASPVSPPIPDQRVEGPTASKVDPAGVATNSPEMAAKPEPPLIEMFQASPESIERGTGVTLRWKVKGGTRVKVEPDSGLGVLPLQGERTVFPSEDRRYTLTAAGPGGAVSNQLWVRVATARPPVIRSFHAEQVTIEKGSSTTLRWEVAGAESVKIDPGGSSLPTQGDVEVAPEQTTQYTLNAENSGGRVSGQVIVKVAPAPRPAISFEADPPSVLPGHSAIIRWTVSGASRIFIDPDLGAQNSQGSATVHPAGTTRYRLVATGPGGTSAKELTVAVTQPAASAGQIVWKGTVNGVQLITIDKDHADIGNVEGSLPGMPCIIQPLNEKKVSVAAAPSPRNNYERLVLRVSGNGPTTVVVKWSLQ